MDLKKQQVTCNFISYPPALYSYTPDRGYKDKLGLLGITFTPQPYRKPMNQSAAHAYECALMMTEKVAQTIWSVVTGLVATHAFLVALSTYALTQKQIAPYATKGMAILGLLVCLAWFLISQRSFSFYAYYFACARKYEADAFGNEITMVREGAKFSAGETARLGAESMRMDWGGRLFKVKWLVLAVISVFALIYLYIFSQA